MLRGLLPLLLALTGWGVARADPLPGAAPLPAPLQARIEAARSRAGHVYPLRTRHRDAAGRPRFANRLGLEHSPYLLQHAHNPVNWFPWGEEAFAEARRLGRPVLLSVGYSTCHWCHVMEEESFEDLEIAEFLNRNYVAIKVDREERPDVDGVYMTALHLMTGQGGWPMTVWMTPEGEAFYGGTYFPPRDGMRGGRPGFLTLLRKLHEVYTGDPGRVTEVGARLRKNLKAALTPEPSVGVPSARDIRRALTEYENRFDRNRGGVQGRRKFPATLPISLLLRGYRRTGDADLERMARITLESMRRGGIYDHVGGGFHRYTVDSSWTVPHFEKMLYDNALLARVYVEGWQVTGEPQWEWVARDVLAYVAREMTAPEGSFYSATDADSEGEEGRYFIWTRETLAEAAGPELAELALEAYGLDRDPNFEREYWVLRRDRSVAELGQSRGLAEPQVEAQLAEIRARMRTAREKRVPPLRDDKQLVAWNGLMISSFARAGLALRDPDLVDRGARAARTLLDRGRPQGRLARYLMRGEPHGTGTLDDYAFLIAAVLDLFEATGDPSWLRAALSLQADQDRRFFDELAGGYWRSPADGEQLLVREKPVQDSARPSGNAVAVANLLRLYHLTTDPQYQVRAEMTLRVFSDLLRDSPTAYARMLEALDFLLDSPKEILIVTPGPRSAAEPFLSRLGRVYLPNRVLAVTSEQGDGELATMVPILEGKRALGGQTTAYVCENRVCDLPARDPELFAKQIQKAPRPYAAGDGTASP